MAEANVHGGNDAITIDSQKRKKKKTKLVPVDTCLDALEFLFCSSFADKQQEFACMTRAGSCCLLAKTTTEATVCMAQ